MGARGGLWRCWSYLMVLALLGAGPAASCSPAATATASSGYSLRQGGFLREFMPLIGESPVAAFYNYLDYRANNHFALPDHSLIFLYRESESGELSLVIIHDSPGDGTGGAAIFRFSGLPRTAVLVLLDDDDGSDRFSLAPPQGEARWYWYPGHTDGLVIGGLGEQFEITIFPDFLWGINGWDLLTGGLAAPVTISLPSLSEPLTITARNLPPRAAFTVLPPDPCIYERVRFDATTSRDPDGEIVSYEWDLDGDGSYEIRLPSPQVEHAFSEASTHQVGLRVRDNLGAIGVTTQPVVVREEIVSASRAISTPFPDYEVLSGGTFRVTVTIEAHGTIIGLGLDEDLPPGWEVRPLRDDGAQFKSSSTQWLFFEQLEAGEERVITYEVRVPGDARPGAFPISGRVITTLPAAETAVRGDREVKVVRFLSIRVAISRLDVETGEINPNLPNIISFPQIQFAVALWLEDRPVPGTNGKKIDLKTMVELVAYWLTDTPVDQPLKR